MLKIIFYTSEKKKKFGVYKVTNILKTKLKYKINILLSNSLLDIFSFKPNIIHIHGCWHPRLLLVFILSKILFIKIILSPHGMLDPKSLLQKKIKKQIAWYLYQKIILFYSNLIIVNSELEKINLLKKIAIKNNVEIIPHGIEIPKKFFSKKNINKKLKFVFFSKIHASKNLLALVKLWEKSIFLKKFDLNIYGEINDKIYFSKVNTYIKRNENINYLGLLNKNIQFKLSNFDVLIHPSESENFGLVIYEALSSGLFLILNKKLKKKHLEQNYFAKCINFNTQSLNNSIKKILKDKKRIKSLAYKQRCLAYVKNNYDWKKISSIYIKNYNELLDN